MKIVHMADTHLGFLQYYRATQAGANQRREDVTAAFVSAVDQILMLRPDLVLLAGDTFHSVRPPNSCILDAYRQFRRLQEAGIPVVLVGGNHDTPRSAETGIILHLMAEFSNVHVVVQQPAAVRIGDVSIHCWPTGAELNEATRPAPDPTAPWNLFLAHWEADQQPQPWAYGSWDYVALGDYHVAHEVQPAVWYAGSLERVSSNPWGEIQEEQERGLPGKGFLLVELRRGEWPLVEFVPIEGRRYLDLPAIDAAGCEAAEVDQMMADQVAVADVGGAVVRQVILNAPRKLRRELNGERIREYKATALHFHLDARPPEIVRQLGAPRLLHSGRTLADLVEDYLRARPPVPGVQQEELVRKGREFMDRALAGAE